MRTKISKSQATARNNPGVLILPPALGRKEFFCHALRVAQIKFGTDGWRAVIAEDFTFANVARVAQATADFWKSEIFGREPKVVVGYDRRFLSDRFAQITAEVFAGNGFQVILTLKIGGLWLAVIITPPTACRSFTA